MQQQGDLSSHTDPMPPQQPPDAALPATWLAVVTSWLKVGTVATLVLMMLYVGTYFGTAFACGAGWMESGTRRQIVWTVHWPISKHAVNESLDGPRVVNRANAWCFQLGWNHFHR